MSFEIVIINRLKDEPSLSVVADAIYMYRLHEKQKLPAVAIYLIDEIPVLTMGAPVSLVQARVQIDVFAKTYSEGAYLADSIRKVLHLYSFGAVEAIFFDKRKVLSDKDTDTFTISQDFIVNYNANV